MGAWDRTGEADSVGSFVGDGVPTRDELGKGD